MKVRVFYHDKCFDGAASAALFTRFYRERIRDGAEFIYTGLLHRAGSLFDEREFDGDENAIVDFKYSPSPRITWWFDHHQSAFLTPEDHQHFLEDQSSNKFYDPGYRSCTKFLATIAETRFGFDPKPMQELIQWADIIDGAKFESAYAAVEMAHPAMKLTMVIEASQDDSLTPKIIQSMIHHRLAEIVEEPFVARLLPPLLDRHRRSIDIMRQRTEYSRGTIYFDVTDLDLDGYNKFVPYYLYPEATYSVGLSRSSFRTKVAVGSNPWTTAPPQEMINLAAICERYGGGGHARVGAISFPPDQGDRARVAAKEIVEELRSAHAQAAG